MTDFVMPGSRDKALIRRLLEAIPGLADAAEYPALDASDKSLPYIVVARAGEYWERLEREGQAHALNALSDGLETLAGERDAAIRDLVVAILNVLASNSALARQLRLRLGPNARALFEKFVQ